MRLTVTLRQSGHQDRDIVVQAELALPIGVLAQRLAAGLRRQGDWKQGAELTEALTLAVTLPSRPEQRTILDPASSIEHSPLRSGAWVEIVSNDDRDSQTPANSAPPISPGKQAEFIPQPRVEPYFRPQQLLLPTPPHHEQHRARFPLLALLAPAVLGLVMYLLFQSPVALMMLALTPLMMLGSWLEGRVSGRKKYRTQLASFEEDLERARQDLDELHTRERFVRDRESPAMNELLAVAQQGTALLWSRRPEHRTFGEVRFGLGTDDSRISCLLPERAAAGSEHWRLLECLSGDAAKNSPLPIVESLQRAGNIAVVGGDAAAALFRALLLQLAILHSPRDLVIAAAVSGREPQDWAWLKWLPHADAPGSPLASQHLVTEEHSMRRLLSALEGELEQRRGLAGDVPGKNPARYSHRYGQGLAGNDHGDPVTEPALLPLIVLAVIARPEFELERFIALAEQGPAFGIHLVWFAERGEDVPAACRSFVDWRQELPVFHSVRLGRSEAVPLPEQMSQQQATGVARLLSSLRDAGTSGGDAADLPQRVTLRELSPSPGLAEDIAQNWSGNDSILSHWVPGQPRADDTLRAAVGLGGQGVLELDLRRDGPHALVGGTTGSGKSEFLQSWILSLAARHSPDRLNFLLVDYKGGSAFADCVQLPHTVGLVTDLDDHLVQRALISLGAELRYRERLLNRAAVKDLMSLERQSDRSAPPSLVIVIDEFAALTAEVPEFVEGLVDIAQRGRSLGLHLILATQRPAGVIRENIRANTNLRIAFRMAERSDSVDVLGDERAALIDPAIPGRGLFSLGSGRAREFQAAFSGGLAGTEKNYEVDIFDSSLGADARWPEIFAPPRDTATRTEAQVLVREITAAHSTLGLSMPRKPWLPPLPTVLDLGVLQELESDHLRQGATPSVLLGFGDLPEQQEQFRYCYQPDEGNFLVVGAAGSGKSTALRTLLFSFLSCTGEERSAFVLDFGSGGFDSLEELPGVGGVLRGDDTERLRRLCDSLSALVRQRGQELAAAKCNSFSDYLAAGYSGSRILVAIDGVGAFRQQYEFQHEDLLGKYTALATTGRQLGIHFLFAADREAALPSALLTSVSHTLVLRQGVAGDYPSGAAARALAEAPPGRGFWKDQEVQIALIGGESSLHDQALTIAHLAREQRVQGRSETPGVGVLTECITLAELGQGLSSAKVSGVVLGISGVNLEPLRVRLHDLVLVQGGRGSGTTTAVCTLVSSALASRVLHRPVLLGAGPSPAHSLACWAQSAVGDAEVSALARWLTELSAAEFSAEIDLLVVENIADFEGMDAQALIVDLVKLCRKRGVTVVLEVDPATAGAAWQLAPLLKSARSGLFLQPTEHELHWLLAAPLPKPSRAGRIPGRGFWVSDGAAEEVQVALGNCVNESSAQSAGGGVTAVAR